MRPIPLHFTPPQGAVGLPEARDVVVDRDDAGQELALEPPRRLLAARPAARGEAVRAVVREADRLVERVHHHDRQHGPEGLLPHDRHGVVHVHEDGGRVEEAGAGGDGAAGEDARALRHRVRHVLLDDPALPLEGQGAHVAPARGRGEPNPAGLLEHLREERLRHRLLDVDALDRGAGLPGVQEGGPRDSLRGAVEVGVAADDRGVLAAELEDHRGEVLRRRGHDLPAGGHAAREHDLADPRVLDERRRRPRRRWRRRSGPRPGSPAFCARAPIRRPIRVVAGAGLRTTVFPATSAEATTGSDCAHG